MINATRYAQLSVHNPHQAAESRQTGAIQAPTPSAGALAAVPRVTPGCVAKADDTAESFMQELQQWVDQAPRGEKDSRVRVAKEVLKVYEDPDEFEILNLDFQFLTSLPNLDQLSDLQVLGFYNHNLGALAENPQAAKAIFDKLGQLSSLKALYLGRNDFGEFTKNPQATKAFFDELGKLSNLRLVCFFENKLDTLADNLESAKAFFNGLGQLSSLQQLELVDNNLGALAKTPQAVKALADGLGQLFSLQYLRLCRNNLGALAENPEAMEALRDGLGQLCNLQTLDLSQNSLGMLAEKLQEPVRLRATLSQHNIKSERSSIIEQNNLWSPIIAERLFEQCATVTDAMSAYELLAHVHDKGELSRREVQSKLETICLAVAKKLIHTDTQGEEALSKVRSQELAYLLTLVQRGARIGALTNAAALNIQLHIQNNPRVNQAFSTIQALQQDEQAMSVGLQAVSNALGQHIQHTLPLQMQYNNCFQRLAKNQQQLLIKQNQLERAHGSMLESLHAEIETLSSNQVQVANNLHQVGLKMLSAQRIKAIGGLLATGVAFLPWVGAGIVEGGSAIANALGLAKVHGFDAGLEGLKDSLADMGSASVFKTLSFEQQNLTLGEALRAHGIQLPSDTLTMQFANIKLGDLMGNTNIQQSHGALPRADSTGSLATEDEEQDELAAAIKYYDESNEYSVEYLNNLVEDAVGDEQRIPMSTILTAQTLPTRNSNMRRATALDLAAQYGRPQILETLNNAARATRNSPNAVKLKSAQGKVFSRALSEAISRQGTYNSLGQRITPKPEVQQVEAGQHNK